MFILTNKVGLSITEDKIQLVEIVKKENIYYLESVDEEYFEESIYYGSKETKFIHILQNAFNEIALRKPLSSNKISITLPPSYFKIFEIPADNNLTKNDLNEYIKWEISKLFPNEKSDHFTYQKLVLDSSEFHPYKRILVFAIPVEILKRIHKFCSRNSLQLRLIDNAHSAATGFILNKNTDSTKLSTFIENNVISVMLFNGQNLAYTQRKDYKTVSEIPTILKTVIEEIKQRDLSSKEIEKLYISGNSVTNELKKNIESSLNLEFEENLPFENLSINPELDEAKYLHENSSKFAPAAAIALRIGS